MLDLIYKFELIGASLLALAKSIYLVLEDEVAFYLGFALATVDGCGASGSSSAISFVVYEEDCLSVFFDLR